MSIANLRKLVVDTDVIIDYLFHSGTRAPHLRGAMEKYLCYTTVFNAIELFSSARTAAESRTIEQTLGAMKLLGLNARVAKRLGHLFRKHPKSSFRDLLVAGVCLEGKLPLLTRSAKRFHDINGLRIIEPSVLE